MPVGPPERDELLTTEVEVDLLEVVPDLVVDLLTDLVVVVAFLLVVVVFFVFEVATQSAHGSFVCGSVGAGPMTVSVLVNVRINVPPLLSSLSTQSIHARSSDGCGPVQIVLVTTGPLVGFNSINIPVLVVIEPAVVKTTTIGPALVIVSRGFVQPGSIISVTV